jgi:hypothetical protein
MFRAVLDCPNQIEKSQQIAAHARRIWVAQVALLKWPKFAMPGQKRRRPSDGYGPAMTENDLHLSQRLR